MPIRPQPLFLLHHDLRFRAHLAGAVPEGMVSVEVTDWHALADVAVRASPGAVCVVDPYLGRSARQPNYALAVLLQRFPRLRVLCAADFDASDRDDVLLLGRWGVAEVFVTGQEALPGDLQGRLRDLRDAYVPRVFNAIPAPAFTEAQHTLLREALRVAAGRGRVRDWADLLGTSRRDLRRRTTMAGLPPPRTLLGWARLLLTADLLPSPGHTIYSASAACGYAADQPLRQAVAQMIGTAAAACMTRENAPGIVGARFAEEMVLLGQKDRGEEIAVSALRGRLAAREWAVLRVLERRARVDAGWRWGGVAGWALYDDVAVQVDESVPGVLPSLAKLGLADRVDVRPPGRDRSVWLYRISARGVRVLAEHDGVAPAALAPFGEDPADGGTYFLPRRVWPAILALQTRAGAGFGAWMTLQRLTALGAQVATSDVDWLLRNGLVERRRLSRALVSGTWSYRVTPMGRHLEATAPPSNEWVRVRLRPPGDQ